MLKEEYYAERDADAIDISLEHEKTKEDFLERDEVLEDNDLNHGFPVEDSDYLVKTELANYVERKNEELKLGIDEADFMRVCDEFYAELVENGFTEDDFEGKDELLLNALDNIKAENSKTL